MYTRKRTRAVVSLASPVHHWPQTGLAQIIPEMSISPPNTTPTSAAEWAMLSARALPRIRKTILAMATMMMATIETQASGTWK